MSLEKSIVREELVKLRAQKADVERRIQGLEQYLGRESHSAKRNTSSMSGFSARGGIDIRPAVKEIFTQNDNTPIKLKDLVVAVVKKYPEVEKVIIEKKMVHVKRTILEKIDYGRYHLKTN